MSLHIQMAEEAEAELKKQSTRNKVSSSLAGLLFILLGGLILYLTVILIAGPSDPEFMTYTPPAEDLPPTPQPTTQDLSSKPSSPSHDVAPSVIVAVGAAPVQMAQVDVQVNDAADGTGLELGVGMGTGGLGDGLGSGGNGLGDGKGGGSALEGTFYDLKQTRQGSPIAYNNNTTVGILNEFVNSWNQDVLSKFYQSPTKLYASNFCLPKCKAEYAPIAYQCKDKCQPSHWVAVYRGKVKAPKTGTFRFCGTGDDTLCVRFNNELVLESGWTIPSTNVHAGGANPGWRQNVVNGQVPELKGYEYITVPEMPTWSGTLGGLAAGREINVQEGKTYPIEIMISEIPGGAFGFVLLMQEKVNGIYDNTKFDLFRTNFSCPTAADIQALINQENCGMGALEFPKFNEDSPIWVAVP